MKNGNVILGILGGVAVGAIAGVLFAPDKGSKTRKKIKNKITDKKDDLKAEFEDFLSKIEDKYLEASEKTKEVVEKAKK
ncbi:MAG: YtxH domain-containing protein [Flavobacterium sp.]|nr:YtxH domain-containing protein [Flavobacterium sp.]